MKQNVKVCRWTKLKLQAEVQSINEEESFSAEHKQKKIDAATSRILKKEVNAEAACKKPTVFGLHQPWIATYAWPVPAL